jgi:hypothetical protein
MFSAVGVSLDFAIVSAVIGGLGWSNGPGLAGGPFTGPLARGRGWVVDWRRRRGRALAGSDVVRGGVWVAAYVRGRRVREVGAVGIWSTRRSGRSLVMFCS